MANIIDWTIVESTDGHIYSVEINDDDTVRFADFEATDFGRTFAFSDLADVTDALSLDIGAGRYLDATAVANAQQFARI